MPLCVTFVLASLLFLSIMRVSFLSESGRGTCPSGQAGSGASSTLCSAFFCHSLRRSCRYLQANSNSFMEQFENGSKGGNPQAPPLVSVHGRHSSSGHMVLASCHKIRDLEQYPWEHSVDYGDRKDGHLSSIH